MAWNLDLGSKRDCTIYVVKTKAIAETKVLICAYVFVCAKSRFSHDAAQIIF